MKSSSSYTYHALLLLSFAHASCSIASGIPQSIEGSFDYGQEKALESTQPEQPSLADHLKHALAAGLIKTCETHHINELNAHLYSPEDGSTFSSMVSTNGDGLLDRMARITGTQPTISISSGTVFTPEETDPKIRFKQAILKFAANPDLPCIQKTDSNGHNIIVCTIVMTLKEFHALKEQYKNSNP